jgi:hypothetical protein
MRRRPLDEACITRLAGSYFTVPSPGLIRDLDDPGRRLDAARQVLEHLTTMTGLYEAIIDDAASTIHEQSTAMTTWDQIATRAGVNPMNLMLRVAARRGSRRRSGSSAA